MKMTMMINIIIIVIIIIFFFIIISIIKINIKGNVIIIIVINIVINLMTWLLERSIGEVIHPDDLQVLIRQFHLSVRLTATCPLPADRVKEYSSTYKVDTDRHFSLRMRHYPEGLEYVGEEWNMETLETDKRSILFHISVLAHS
ncbi:hypothetical protein ACOMHN_026982 [Nucella lapillus]